MTTAAPGSTSVPAPHWGKVFTTDPDVVRGLYPRLPDFQLLLTEHDPSGKLRNEMLDTYILPR